MPNITGLGMRAEDGLIVAEGTVTKIEPSKIPRVSLITIDCGDLKVKLDLVKELITFDEGDKVSVTISREKPDFTEGKDLVVWGYVMGKKKVPSEPSKEPVHKLLISLWGYLLVLESSKNILDSFAVMDKVYMKISQE